MSRYQTLKENVYEANMELQRRDLVIYTFGNVSEIDRDKGVFAIKPSGVKYRELKPSDIVVLDLELNVVEGKLRPSSDTKTHAHLYNYSADIGGVTHTHSTYATAWAQAKRSIPCYGTTHADYVYGDVPCTDIMTDDQIEGDYELETGIQITNALASRSPKSCPMILVAGHAPFTWGKNASESVYHAAILEELAHMAQLTCSLTSNQHPEPLKQGLLNKHYERKHGTNAYYGQTTLTEA
jgi:L-ribulose-5-phosphate 4-epimerase